MTMTTEYDCDRDRDRDRDDGSDNGSAIPGPAQQEWRRISVDVEVFMEISSILITKSPAGWCHSIHKGLSAPNCDMMPFGRSMALLLTPACCSPPLEIPAACKGARQRLFGWFWQSYSIRPSAPGQHSYDLLLLVLPAVLSPR